MSIKLDTFPSKCKIANVKSLFTNGIKTEAKNDRPISLLPLTLIWVGSLGVRFEVGERGKITPPLSKTC